MKQYAKRWLPLVLAVVMVCAALPLTLAVSADVSPAGSAKNTATSDVSDKPDPFEISDPDLFDNSDTSEETSEPSEEPSEPSEEPSEPSEEPSEEPSDVSDGPDPYETSDPDQFDSSEPDEPGMLGDANRDGSVDMKDVLIIRKFIANMGVEIDEIAADVNRDNSVDMKDVLLIRKYIAGLIESFEA